MTASEGPKSIHPAAPGIRTNRASIHCWPRRVMLGVEPLADESGRIEPSCVSLSHEVSRAVWRGSLAAFNCEGDTVTGTLLAPAEILTFSSVEDQAPCFRGPATAAVVQLDLAR